MIYVQVIYKKDKDFFLEILMRFSQVNRKKRTKKLIQTLNRPIMSSMEVMIINIEKQHKIMVIVRSA